MVQGDRVPDRDRPQVRRQAPGVHPAVRHAWASACWSTTSTTAASPARRPSTVEGPFHIPNAPEVARRRRHGEGRARHSVLRHRHGARASTASRSRARCSTCGRPTAKASTRSSAAPPSRGCAASTARRPDGSYSIRTVAPISYTIPMDGPVGDVLRPHQHEPHAPGAHPLRDLGARLSLLVTHLFQKGDEYIENDVVYGVKDAAGRRVREEAARQGAERRDGRHAVLRGEVRLRAGAEAGGARGGGIVSRSCAAYPAALPGRPCRQPAAPGGPEGGAREARRGRDFGGRPQGGRRPRDRARHRASRKRSGCKPSPTASSAARGGISISSGASTASSAM